MVSFLSSRCRTCKRYCLEVGVKDIYEKWHGIYTLNWHTGGYHTLSQHFTLLTLTLLTDIGYPFRFLFFKEKP